MKSAARETGIHKFNSMTTLFVWYDGGEREDDWEKNLDGRMIR